MKVYNLVCGNDHRFEGWFTSDEDRLSQGERGLIACPLCGDSSIRRVPSAPRVHMSRPRETGGKAPSSADRPERGTQSGRGERGERPAQPSARSGAAHEAPPAAPPASAPVPVQVQMLRALRHVLAHTEDVGTRFPEEARRIHYGEAAERGIRGRATPEEAAALAEEGIEVVAVPMPPEQDGPLH